MLLNKRKHNMPEVSIIQEFMLRKVPVRTITL